MAISCMFLALRIRWWDVAIFHMPLRAIWYEARVYDYCGDQSDVAGQDWNEKKIEYREYGDRIASSFRNIVTIGRVQ